MAFVCILAGFNPFFRFENVSEWAKIVIGQWWKILEPNLEVILMERFLKRQIGLMSRLGFEEILFVVSSKFKN